MGNGARDNERAERDRATMNVNHRVIGVATSARGADLMRRHESTASLRLILPHRSDRR